MYLAYLTTLVEELESRAIPASSLVDPLPEEIGQAAFAELLEKARLLSEDPAFGLAFGRRLNLASHGVLGYALMSSRNGRQLIASLTRFARLATPSMVLLPVERGETFRLLCRARAPVAAYEFLCEVVLATLVTAARTLFNRRIPGAAVWLDYPAPRHQDSYRMLGVPVLFDQPDCALVCDRSFLDMELPGANPVLAEIGQRQCSELLKQMQARTGIAAAVRAELVRTSVEFPGQEAVAEKLNISARTLRRQLLAENTSYRDILDEVRYELAKRYLATGELPVTEVALLLGYDDPANFRRAFRRWSGMTAQQWQESYPGYVETDRD